MPIEIDNYKKIIDGNYYYVDKTLLIKDLLDNTSEVTLFTRPRRFGKTLIQSMLQTFFEIETDINGNKYDNSPYFKFKGYIPDESMVTWSAVSIIIKKRARKCRN